MFSMNEISVKTKQLLTFSMLRGIGPATLRKVAGVPNFELLSNEELSYQVPIISKVLHDKGVWEKAVDDAERQIEEARRYTAHIFSPLDSEYPPLLAGTKDDPFLLFVRGRLARIPSQSVAIIGTRKPTAHGVLIARRTAQFFVESQWSVVSGLAIGCDETAHQAALDAGGHTVAVLAHGLHTIAPVRHRKLAEDIISSGGALVSEFRFGQEARPELFVKRDLTQAGMACGVVMIQSDMRGGSLHASRAALSYKRWLAVPYPTERDVSNKEPKIQANLMIAEGNGDDRKELLCCSQSELDRVMILRGKDDYPKMIEKLSTKEAAQNPPQRSLF